MLEAEKSVLRILQILDQEHLVPALVIDQFVHAFFGKKNAEAARAHPLLKAIHHVLRRGIVRIGDG